MQTTTNENSNNIDIDKNRINVKKMQFKIVNECPEKVENDIKEQIELQLYNIFKKYDI